jgi:hypothetical protein
MPNSLSRNGGNSGTCYKAIAKDVLAIERTLGDERGMSTRSRKQSDDKQIFAQIVEEAAQPRQAASVKKALEKKNLAVVSVGKFGESKGRENQSR